MDALDAYQLSVARLLRREDSSPQIKGTLRKMSAEEAVRQFEEMIDRNHAQEAAAAVTVDVPLAWQGPAAYARALGLDFRFNQEQIEVLALLVLPLQEAWLQRQNKETYTLPPDLGLVRVLLVGGGGCGKTTLIM